MNVALQDVPGRKSSLMRIAVLTTETTHHTFFVRELGKVFPELCVVVEQQTLSPRFETHHPFEHEREEYERRVFFDGNGTTLADIARPFLVDSVNDPRALEHLTRLKPDVMVVFGTGIIREELLRLASPNMVNLHGGDPEAYRGLDSHLWAIYHRDYSNLITTLHYVNKDLDDGEIILQAPIRLFPGMRLHELRRFNTEVCVQLVVSALDMYARFGRFISRPQRSSGRYYSFMPAVLKDICVKRFESYTAKL
ncbi:MAG: formyltransferase family protein [bacterium]